MKSIERHAHWQTVYQTKGEHDVSWFEESPAISRVGPKRCSGLPVARYDPAAISKILGASFDLSESRTHAPKTPTGTIQHVQFSRFRRLN
jgi:hypothetical protein